MIQKKRLIEQHGDAFAMGFRAGEAEAKVLQAFRRFPMKPGGALRVKGDGNGGTARGKQTARQLVEVEEIVNQEV